MRTLQTNIYKFVELSKEAQQKAIETMQENQYFIFEDWSIYIKEDFKNRMLKDYDINVDDIYFSGFYSQGDGACFTGNVKILDYLKATKQQTKLKKLSRYLMGYPANIEIKQQGLYYHENSMTFNDNYFTDATEKQQDLLYSIMDEIQILCIKEAVTLYRNLRNEYEDLQSDDCIRETLEDESLELFLTTGELA